MSDKVTNACLGCTERRVGCHSECERYALYREHREAMLDARDRSIHNDAYFATKCAKIKQISENHRRKMGRG